MMPQWEYITLSQRDIRPNVFNDLGVLGWELVCILPGGAGWATFYFKRQLTP